MTDVEIKKAFDTMKRKLAKEIGIKSGYYCKAKQIGNRTATLCVCNDIPYEQEILREQEIDKRIQGYSNWCEDAKACRHADAVKRIAKYQAKLMKYKTKSNEAKSVKETIERSKAFKEFADNFESATITTEEANGLYYIRFNY